MCLQKYFSFLSHLRKVLLYKPAVVANQIPEAFVKVFLPSRDEEGFSLHSSQYQLLDCFPGSMILQYKSEFYRFIHT